MQNNDFARRARELVARMTLAEKCSQLRYDAPAIERLGIPAYNWWNECLHGVARSGAATVFPQAIGMAASFDERQMERIGAVISDEARAKYNEYRKFGNTGMYQGLTCWSPNINIFRDPRWGRGHETYSEDPFLTGHMGAAFVRGLQGRDKRYRKVDATIKHYAVHSGPEPLRHGFDVKIGKRELMDTYLSAFAYCIAHADPSAVMGAYNRVNGEPCCASPTLLKKLLRGRFRFKGYVVSDCGAICDINEHHRTTANKAESAALAVNNGCDLNCGTAYHALTAAVAAGLLDEAAVTTAAERLFETRFRLGMFDDDCPYDAIPYERVECPAHRRLSREAALGAAVLLKNNGILPLKNDKELKLALIGPNADEVSVLLGNYNGTPTDAATLLRGLLEKFKGKLYYARGCHHYGNSDAFGEEGPEREALIAAQKSDVVVMAMGINPRMEGEEGDSSEYCLGGDRVTIELPKVQKDLYRKIIAIGKPVIFVNVSGSAVALGEQTESAAALIQLFYPGAEGGRAFADILFGDRSPRGHLPVTFYRSDADLPPFEDYSMENRTYRYFRGTPLYPFGWGLSYASAELLSLAGEETVGRGKALELRTELINRGDRPCEELLQLYLSDEEASCTVPLRKLIALRRVKLRPGERRTVTLRVSAADMSFYNDEGRLTLEKGFFTAMLGDKKHRFEVI